LPRIQQRIRFSQQSALHFILICINLAFSTKESHMKPSISIEHLVPIDEFLSEIDLEDVLNWYKRDLTPYEFQTTLLEFIDISMKKKE
jgi:hypothetical protein